MKAHVLTLIFLSFCVLFIQAVPVPKATELASHERQLLRELLCIMQGKTTEECLQDDTLDLAIQRLQLKDKLDSGRELSQIEALKKRLPMPPSSKRDAFYSDWRRRR